MQGRETLDHGTRIALLESQMDRLFGVNGQTGIIDQMRRDIGEIKELVFKARYVLMGCFLAVIAFQVLTGTGTISLHELLKALGHT